MKSGDIIQIGDKSYEVTECEGSYRRCRICAENNISLPCFSSGWSPTAQWSQMTCNKQLPQNCYLKPV